MTFTETISHILSSAANPITPQEMREAIKKSYPEFYGTKSHTRNVEKGHYKDIDHALLAQIYSTVRSGKGFLCDNDSKPIKISLRVNEDNETREEAPLIRQKQRRLFHPIATAQFAEKIKDILENADKYHEAYYKAEPFRGPSLYFHQRALETRHSPGSLPHLEHVYATLASWGMHRMGRGGSKMQSFDVFRRSIDPLQNLLVEAQRFDFREMDDEKWTLLKEIFFGLKVMASNTSLVGNSKVMHHMLPNVVPPIDREYTLWYLFGSKNVKNDLDREWELMKKTIAKFFIPLASIREFELRAQEWSSRMDVYPWDTSFLKIVDNLVIGSKK